MIHSASRRALDDLRSREHEIFEQRGSSAALVELAQELYSVAGVLAVQPRLRRTLSDASSPVENRTGLVGQLFGGRVGDATAALLTAAVELRWSSSWDLSDALEGAADDAVFRAAEKDGRLDVVEAELFRLERILDAEGDLVSLLDERTTDADRRIGLLDRLVRDRASSFTVTLLHNAVRSTRKRSVLLALDDLLERAAAWQERSVARIVSAIELSPQQVRRVTVALTETYGRPIVARTAVDPSLKGGLVVRVGDDVIDGSVVSRLAAVRTALTS